MTKHYHISPERAEEIWSEVESNRGFSADLAAFANAVLDEVLGDPVAEITENILWGKDIRWPVDLPVVGTKLYAPKVMT